MTNLNDSQEAVTLVCAQIKNVLLDVYSGDVAVVGGVKGPEGGAEWTLDLVLLQFILIILLVDSCKYTQTFQSLANLSVPVLINPFTTSPH